jgi:hypothetical protein
VRVCNRYVSEAAAGVDQDGTFGNGVAAGAAATWKRP